MHYPLEGNSYSSIKVTALLQQFILPSPKKTEKKQRNLRKKKWRKKEIKGRRE